MACPLRVGNADPARENALKTTDAESFSAKPNLGNVAISMA